MDWNLAILLAVGVFVCVQLIYRRWFAPKPKAMKEYARALAFDPDFEQEEEQACELRSQLIDTAYAAQPPTTEQIPRLVEALLDPDPDIHDPAEIRLEKAGFKAVPALLKALDDPRAIWERKGDHSLDSSPADRICNLLWRSAPRKLGERIGHLWNHPECHAYTLAIKSRAALGTAASSDWVVSILRDESHPESSLRSASATEGLDMAISNKWIETGLIEALVDWARQNITESKEHPSDWAVKFLNKQRPDEALELFKSDRLLSLDNNRNIHFVLDELNRRNVNIPADLVRAIVQKALTATEWPWKYTFGSAIEALARIDPDEAIRIAESIMLDKEHNYAAMKILYKLRDLPESHRLEPPPDMSLNDDEQRLLKQFGDVIYAQSDISNGGLSQYFFNSNGDKWREHIVGFNAIGFPEGAAALEHAGFIFDRNGVSTNRDQRIKQYATLPEKKERQLDALSEVFWGPSFKVAEYRYLLAHADLFRRVRAARLAAGMDERESEEQDD